VRWPDKTAGVGGMRGGALFCLDLQTRILAQKLSFLPFFFIKKKEQNVMVRQRWT